MPVEAHVFSYLHWQRQQHLVIDIILWQVERLSSSSVVNEDVYRKLRASFQ